LKEKGMEVDIKIMALQELRQEEEQQAERRRRRNRRKAKKYAERA
jgi:hypothetical protein